MSNDAGDPREYVGFVWPQDNFFDQTGLLVLATNATEAAAVAREAYGDDFRVSLWNPEDATKPR